ncbi:histidine kinase [Asanoa ishikariensis]|uniref:Uncharacterized conserved protein YecE, DUF72 family n=1 Tax=Asanoa ishikariensis TaxID=137265 RepID=A0A1H3TU62_9ACTN|nr:DUF72 domain-containing protein [Asanoa ishikariensis]GIF67501.1 histidine kinase [Asanoa ishikariensis]SDZ53770.1 Uncharacterized conserved protein YecE, DUF72 family [Asanoa ishikariensis]
MILVGTSGWQYRDWRGPFYPEKLPQRAWLEHYAERFATVEINNAFYRLPERDTFAAWRERTPGDFCVGVKMSRYLTHIKRLKDPAEPVKRFLDHADGLGDRLGPVLVQLPPNLKVDAGALDAVLARFPSGIRVAVEPRHESWWVDEVRAVLTTHAAALSWADRLGRPTTPLWRTTDWGYLRFHEGRATPRPRYGRSALRTWAGRLKDAFGADADAYVYFNNDHGGAAVTDAAAFARIAAAAGLTPSRTP